MKAAVAYIRCSTDEQTKDSVPRQRNEIELWTHSNDYTIKNYFIDDGVSGTIPLDERTAGRQLIDEIDRNREIEFVIIWEYSRWGRDADPEQIYFWELYLNRHNVKLISLDNPELTFRTAMERGIMRFVQRQTSTQENKDKSLRSYSGGRRNIELGYLNTNSPPFGYIRAAKNATSGKVRILNDGESIQKKFEKPFLALDDIHSKVARRIFELRASRTSIRRIAQILNGENIPTALGKKWRKNVLNRILKNPIYYGAACWNKTTSSRILAHDNGNRVPKNLSHYTRPVERAKWVINENAGLPPIVSKELWEKANAVSLVERKMVGKSQSSGYLLSGLVFSKHGGTPMVGSQGGQYRRKDGTIVKKRYYVNSNYQTQGSAEGLRSIEAEELESKVVSALKDRLISPGAVKMIEDEVSRLYKEHMKNDIQPSELSRLDRLIAEKTTALNNLVLAIEHGGRIDVLISSLKKTEDDLKGLNQQRSKLSTQSISSGPRLTQAEIGQHVSKCILQFEQMFAKAPIEERKQLVRIWVNRVIVDGDSKQKKARLFINRWPQTAEFAALREKTVLSGPCRT